MIPAVMGVLNATPDSFSDGGSYATHKEALDRAREMWSQGASIIDVGGESTRPGAAPVSVAEELDRVIPLVGLIAAEHMTVSIDTRHAEVAREAVSAGASIINDVSASLHLVAAELGCGWIAMHMSGTPQTMQSDPTYDDVVSEVCEYLVSKASAASEAGVPRMWIDPGFGFGKSSQHNLELIAGLDRFVATGLPVALGVSRKSTLGDITGRSDATAGGDGSPTPPGDRLEAALAIATYAMSTGVELIRTHDVRPTVQAATVVAGEFAA